VRFIGFVWSKPASVFVCVSDFEFTSICPFKGKRVPEYLFSISDTSENDIKIAPPNTLPICVTSALGNNSQSSLPISAEPSLSTLRTTFPYDTSSKEITVSRLFLKDQSCTENTEKIYN
jgi:hypothetical protein